MYDNSNDNTTRGYYHYGLDEWIQMNNNGKACEFSVRILVLPDDDVVIIDAVLSARKATQVIKSHIIRYGIKIGR